MKKLYYKAEPVLAFAAAFLCICTLIVLFLLLEQ